MIKGMALGIVMMVAAQIIMPFNDAIAKYLVALLPVMMIAWSRFFFNALWMIPLVFWQHGTKIPKIERLGLQILRGIVIVSANVCFVTGVRHVPLADALAIVFVAPLAVAALSPKYLGEQVTRVQWGAIGLGFLGALIIIRPGFSELSWAALLPLAAGLQFAVYLILSRLLAASAPPEVTLAISSTTGALILTPIMPFVWQSPSLEVFFLMVLIGTLSGIGHLFVTAAHVHAPASVLAPLTYLSIVTATILGYFMFGDLPDLVTGIGAAIVILSGVFLWRTRLTNG